MRSRALFVVGMLCGAGLLIAGCAGLRPGEALGDTVRGVIPIARPLPQSAPEHPGNVFLRGEDVVLSAPANTAKWRLLDAAGQSAAEGTGSAVRAAGLGVGWFRAEFCDAQNASLGWTTAAVLAPLAAPTPADSPIAIDAASAWFGRDDSARQERFARLAALAGVNWIRDRMSWAQIEPERGTYVARTTYDSAADVQAQAALKTLQVFHGTPEWALNESLDGEGARGRYPRDLRDEYAFCRAMAERFHGRVQAWEPWNEANIPNFGGHLIDEMCALQKAAYWGLKRGDPEIVACWNVFAGGGSGLHTEGVLKNEVWPYFDTYNIHTYDPPSRYLKEFENARSAATGRPIWLSECGIGLHFMPDSAAGELTPELEMKQARFIARSYASSLHAGVSRHFFFILGNYLENVNQFGLLRHDETPRPGYVAMAAVGRLLAGARCIGRVPPASGAGPYVLAFESRPDGNARDVLVIWADEPMQSPPDPGLRIEALYDCFGRPEPPHWPERLDDAAHFAVLPRGESRRLPLDPPPALSPWRSGEASPVVMQVEMPASSVRLSRQAYEIEPGRETAIPVQVYNFGEQIAKGSVAVERCPARWRVELDAAPIAIGPMERRAISLRVWMPEQGPDAVAGAWIVLRGAFGAAGRPVCAFRLVAAPGQCKPAASVALPRANTPERWKDNVVAQASGRHAASPSGGVQFDMRFSGGDAWGFPILELEPAEIPAPEMEGLALGFELIEGEGEVRVQFVEENGAHYVAGLTWAPKQEGPHRALALFKDVSWGAFSSPDPDQALQPEKVRRVLIGVNARPDSVVKMAVRDLAWVRY